MSGFARTHVIVRLNDGVLIPLRHLVGEEVVTTNRGRNGGEITGIVTGWKYRYCRYWHRTEVAVYFYSPEIGRRTWSYPKHLRLAYNDGRYDALRMLFDDEDFG